MNRIFPCGGYGEVRQMAPLEPERTWEQIHECANDLSQRILSNNTSYESLKGHYTYFRDAPGFVDKAFSSQCTNLLNNIETLNLKHESEQREKQTLKEEFHRYLGNHLSPEGEDLRPQAKEVEQLIAIEDDLDKIDPQLDYMRDGTFDCYRELTQHFTDIFCIVAFIVCCPFLSICNPVCCGLKGRVEQLKYAVKKGIA